MPKYKFILINDEDGTETDLSREFIPEKDEDKQWMAAYWQMEEIVKHTLRVVKEKE